MAPQTNKFNIVPTATKPNQITLLSPGIDDNYIMSITTVMVTPDKKTPKKKDKTQIKKVPKIYLGKPYSYHK